ncbi:uncharacterized membrane protein (DUF3120) [Synechococcus sp. BIOS-E4-1]|uniref:DUF3120 domain-containing protein n=1 Tax=Synechococcus sp. BIOS-E4-1 TaxID=1400864 RepID=UPI001862C84F|nr:DUF3120 domain-containing protein [Synechococcus sp. BIOS-E4-1]QNI56513.1 uncharacterized membrane protein (DUF3120) [Synechococcus sp. BIOS-E4-1]
MFSGLIRNQALTEPVQPIALGMAGLPFWASMLVVLPVFVQAPWVRQQPFTSCLFGLVLLSVGVITNSIAPNKWKELGALLVGFSGSWLAGSLFWGWLASHPLLHLPVEAFALPLAITGLQTRWRLGCAFYLASLLGTAFTDLAMALTGVISLWPAVIGASTAEATLLLQDAAAFVLRPSSLLTVITAGAVILKLVQHCRHRSNLSTATDKSWSVAAAVLFTTLLIDGLFLSLSLLAPELSGLV